MAVRTEPVEVQFLEVPLNITCREGRKEKLRRVKPRNSLRSLRQKLFKPEARTKKNAAALLAVRIQRRARV
jgi:hypothetical protein